MKKWLIRHAVLIAVTFGLLSGALATVTIFQAVLLHTQGWRAVSKTLPEWFGAAGSIATFAAFVIALVVFFDNRAQQQRQQAELITVWKIGGLESGSSPNNPVGYTGIRLGFINASKGLAHVQIRLTGELPGRRDQQTHGDARDQVVRLLYVPFLEPGNWEALAAFEGMGLSLVKVEVAFRDQALRWWVRNIDLGTLEPAECGLFSVGQSEGSPSALDLQARRRPTAAGTGNAGHIHSEVVRRLWAIEPVKHWPQDDSPREASPLTQEVALEVAHIRALLAIGEAIREQGA
ncbi:hypothetical protein AOT83_18750 [Mycobacteroides sp. H001]|uniref:hypothetical protein n=1 Tax=Mycobacteroides TaxID=670516 RepID=UPI000713B443|nr:MULTISPECIES: hypothetical protein [Mycobacteroides]KRQ26464.1 hypothetical protein AOT86_11700 [Mycobacteroides sp. H072]KRQ32664.1 hypothetical protein AOT84_20970 [Mycobacteroides sp. H002]KRQ54090.1 hypothetical protein AOT85_05470 [Mycobacteroides sp. H054]KRQ67970.1 hypothetical protein AOT83_18750 [Mycobacteroides sp. H001]OHU42874.1 hypothetical protein BKG79_02475 [Mycobacteroides chelonae]